MKRLALVTLAAALLVGCQDDQGPTAPLGPTPSPLLDVDDGAHSGNPDFFFLPPLVPNPSGLAIFGDNGFNAGLDPAVTVNICPTDVASCPGFDQGGTAALVNEHYQFQWKTNKGDAGTTFRVTAFVASTELGHLHVDVENKPKGKKKASSNALAKAGSNVPVKLFIENAALCDPPGEPPCATETINTAEDNRVELPNGDDGELIAALNLPALNGGSEAPAGAVGAAQAAAANGSSSTITMEPCDDLFVDVPLFSPCIRIKGDPPLPEHQKQALISICGILGTTGLSPAQEEVMGVIRENEGPVVIQEWLPHALENCEPEDMSSAPSNPLFRFARAIRDGAVDLFGAKPLLANTAVVYNRGGGGHDRGGPRSLYQLGLGGTIEILDGNNQTAGLGRAVPAPLRVVVKDLQDTPQPIEGAKVHFAVLAGDGSIGSIMLDDITDANGIAQVSTYVLNSLGVHQVETMSNGNADPSEAPGQPDDADPEADPVPLDNGMVVFDATAELNVLVYGPARGTTAPGADGGSFVTKAQNAGFTVTVFNASQWTTASTATFASFNVIGVPTIFLGQAAQVVTDLATSKVAWGPAITGNIVVSGLHADEHLDAGATQFLENALAFAKSGGGTGFVSLVDCSATPYSWVPSTGPFGGLSALACTGADNITITDGTHPVMAGLISADLSNWVQSLHTFFPSVGGFTTIATGQGGPFSPIPPPGSPAVLVFSTP